MSAALATTRYRIDGMDCAACGTKIANAVRRVPGVADVCVSVTAGTMTVSHEDSPHLDVAVVRQIGSLGGYKAVPSSTGSGPSNEASTEAVHGRDHAGPPTRAGEIAPAWWRTAKARLAAASGGSVVLAWLLAQAVPPASTWLYASAVLVGLLPVARRALASARLGMPFTIETLMTVAAVGALAIGAAEEAAAVVSLFLVGEMLEGVAAGRARASIHGLSALMPKTARVERAAAVEEVPTDSRPATSSSCGPATG